ncbi:MAG: calcium-translocating P-type ATPase, PMCA-type [Methanomicrobiales archaeon]|nr:calcium-translocating P-type ATPase, PMCA-type [Methanomicrobiales archaeon]
MPTIPDAKTNVKTGLNSEQIKRMEELYGKNELTPPPRLPLWKQYLKQFEDPIIRILLVAVIISALVAIIEGSGLLDTVGIVLAVILATSISFLTEFKSNRDFDALNAMRDDAGVRVIRDGHATTIQIRNVVVGDVVILEAGDAVPADGILIDETGFETDESAFTGETEPATKSIDDDVLKGTWVTSGKGTIIVTAVGDATRMGEIAASITRGERPETPLQVKLRTLASHISRFGYGMAGLIIVSLLVKGIIIGLPAEPLELVRFFLDIAIFAVIIIVVSVPEGLPVSVTVSLALTMKKMTRAYSLVRRLIACETIGSVNIICTDKTGTLTMNLMEVAASSIIVPKYERGLPETSAEWITLNAGINSTAELEPRDGQQVTVGNSTEGALLRWLHRAGINYQTMREENPSLSQQLFDSRKKEMRTLTTINGKEYLLVKGAPEVVAAGCSPQPDLGEVKNLADRAMRTLAFAHAIVDDPKGPAPLLLWDGYVGIRDEIRADVPSAVASCKKAGISVKMVTGDSLETACAIAKETGILTTGNVITGPEFRSLSIEEQQSVATDLEVMARSQPHDKLILVQALQAKGRVVAVTGDGTNDAPALRSADVGLAMGIAGTEVAREASDIILLDDSFPTIRKAVWWGRALYENIQRFLIFQLTINISAAILSFIAPLLGYPPPFTVIQLLWINIIMDSLAALALCSESPHPALMDKEPVPRSASVLTSYMVNAILITAFVYVIVGLAGIIQGIPFMETPAEQATAFFTGFVITQVWNGINCRGINGIMPHFIKGNPVFFLIMGGIIAIQFLIVQYGGKIFDTVPLSAMQWMILVFGTMPVLLLWPVLRWKQNRSLFLNKD